MDQVHFARESVAVDAVFAGGVEVELQQFVHAQDVTLFHRKSRRASVLLAAVKHVGAEGGADFDRVAVVHDGVLFIAR